MSLFKCTAWRLDKLAKDLNLVFMPSIALFFHLLESFVSCEIFSQLSPIINFVVIACIVDDESILGYFSFMAAVANYMFGIMVGM
jgi:hypothetical protein